MSTRWKPGDRVRLPALNDSSGWLHASHCVNVISTAQDSRQWLVVLPQVNSHVWVDERYLRPADEVTL